MAVIYNHPSFLSPKHSKVSEIVPMPYNKIFPVNNNKISSFFILQCFFINYLN